MMENREMVKQMRFANKPNVIGMFLIGLGLAILSACASPPPITQDVPIALADLDLDPEPISKTSITAAISQYQQMILDSISEHSGRGHRPAVAVLDIVSDDMELGVFTAEELILRLVRTRRFRVVDRDSIEILLREQNFQLSGMVSDETMVSIGRFIGAAVVVTGQIMQRQGRFDLSLRILDVETAEIINLLLIPIG